MRKRYFGDEMIAQEYTRDATNLLAMVKHDMKFNGLGQLSRRVVLANGVILMASSVFGQDEVRVYAPPVTGGQPTAEAEPLPQLPSFVVVGQCSFPDGSYRPTLWTDGKNPIDLGTLPGFPSGWASAVGGGNGVIFAAVNSDYGDNATYEASRWSAGALEDIGHLPITGGSQQTFAYGVSANGGVIVGESYTKDFFNSNAFMWTHKAGITQLFPDASAGAARAVSADGKVICGSGGGFVQVIGGDLTYWTGDGFFDAYALSRDGSTAVGQHLDPITPPYTDRPSRWVVATGEAVHFSDEIGIAKGVSYDGKISAGSLNEGYPGGTAFRHTDADGLTNLGAGAANGISGTGRIVVGNDGDLPVWWDGANTKHLLPLLAGAITGDAAAVAEIAPPPPAIP